MICLSQLTTTAAARQRLRAALVDYLYRAPFVFVVIAISWGYYAYIYYFCIDFLRDNPLPQAFCLVVMHSFLALFIITYYEIVNQSPMDVPQRFFLPKSIVRRIRAHPVDFDKNDVGLKQFVADKKLPIEMRTFTGGIRFCKRCLIVKPDRCHHCSVCNKCVLKMDHHCPWLRMCIGYANHKFYCLFLGYALLMCAFAFLTTMPYAWMFSLTSGGGGDGVATMPVSNDGGDNQMASATVEPPVISDTNGSSVIRSIISNATHSANGGVDGTVSFDDDPRSFHIITLFCVSAMWALPLGCLLYDHLRMALCNVTSIETVQPVYVEGGVHVPNAYDLGTRRNLLEFFGENPLLWFQPVFSTLGDGLRFPRRDVLANGGDGTLMSSRRAFPPLEVVGASFPRRNTGM